jgi:type VI secretion system protein ImpH
MSSASPPSSAPASPGQPQQAEARPSLPGTRSDEGLTASASGTRDPVAAAALLEHMVAKPWDFNFFQAVRRLENLSRRRVPVGLSRRVQEDVVRFGQVPSLAFAASTLSACQPPRDGRPPRLMVQFFGLCGPMGPLPAHITEYLHQRQKHHGDRACIEFFNLFNHRMTALFYRAWATNQQTVSYERGISDEPTAAAPTMPSAVDRTDLDRFGVFVASLMGRGMPAFRRRDELPDLAKLAFAGHLANQTRNADGLASILSGFFGTSVAIEQFVGQWVEIPAESCCRLGESRETCTLGATAVVGSKIWDCQQKFRIRIGPMDFKHYEHFLPGHAGLSRLAAIVKNYVGLELGWDLQLLLRADEVPTACLGRIGQLGWTTWIGGNAPRERQAENLILQPAA